MYTYISYVYVDHAGLQQPPRALGAHEVGERAAGLLRGPIRSVSIISTFELSI